jgi:porin
MLFRTSSADDEHGLSVFGTVAFGDAATAQYSYSAAVGVVQKGTFASRPADYVGLAVGRVHNNNNAIKFQEALNARNPGSVQVVTEETVYEIDYGVQVFPWLLMRPNVQYIQRPGGSGHIPNAVVLGLTTGIDF